MEDASAITPLVYATLRKLAGSYLRGRQSATLQPTALVHEAFLRLVRQDPEMFRDREHFIAVAATAMRQIVIDYARRRTTAKRGGAASTITLDGAILDDGVAGAAVDVLAVDAALTRLTALSPRQARVVELIFYGGLTTAETAHAIGVSLSLVEKEWRRARAWFHRELAEAV